MRLVLEARITSIKVSDVSVILVGCLEQKFMTARDP